MRNIIAFAGSNSKTSINKQLVKYTVGLIEERVKTTILDLNDFKLPLYSIDLENENGIPDNAHKFLRLIKSSDGVIVSLAEHNGVYTAVFKNILDWMSRIDGELWSEKPMFLMATSPGARGGVTVLEIAKRGFPYMGARVVADFSCPSFFDNFKGGHIVNEELNLKLSIKVKVFTESLNL